MLDPWPDSPYALTVARAKSHICRVWRADFRTPLPSIPVPLAIPDPDIALEIQSMIDEIYRRFRYERSIDYSRPLTPPLNPQETAWWEQRLQARRRRV
jgi:hypothetical protein